MPPRQGERQAEISTPGAQNSMPRGAQRVKQVCLSSKQTSPRCGNISINFTVQTVYPTNMWLIRSILSRHSTTGWSLQLRRDYYRQSTGFAATLPLITIHFPPNLRFTILIMIHYQSQNIKSKRRSAYLSWFDKSTTRLLLKVDLAYLLLEPIMLVWTHDIRISMQLGAKQFLLNLLHTYNIYNFIVISQKIYIGECIGGLPWVNFVLAVNSVLASGMTSTHTSKNSSITSSSNCCSP